VKLVFQAGGAWVVIEAEDGVLTFSYDRMSSRRGTELLILDYDLNVVDTLDLFETGDYELREELARANGDQEDLELRAKWIAAHLRAESVGIGQAAKMAEVELRTPFLQTEYTFEESGTVFEGTLIQVRGGYKLVTEDGHIDLEDEDLDSLWPAGVERFEV